MKRYLTELLLNFVVLLIVVLLPVLVVAAIVLMFVFGICVWLAACGIGFWRLLRAMAGKEAS